MEIKLKDIESLKADKNQPRMFFDSISIREMARSMLTEGVINPIEIDKDNIIVTGEIRWRAAKEAGLRQVPCKVVEVNGKERYKRQVIENIHQNVMTDYELALAFNRLLSTPLKDIKQGQDAGVSQLAREIGKSAQYVLDHINLLEESPEVQDWLKKPESNYSYIREINRHAPEEAKDELKRKVIEGKIRSDGTITELSRALKRMPEAKEELLEQDLSGKERTNINKIHLIVPVGKSKAEHMIDGGRIIQKAAELIHLLKKGDPGQIGEGDRILIFTTLKKELNDEIERYNPEVETGYVLPK